MHALTQYQCSDTLAFRPTWDHPSILDVQANAKADPLALKVQALEARAADCR
jgi:hypothetical protein